MMNKTYHIALMIGRNPDNPSDRSRGGYTVQTLEIGGNDIVHTITTVLKDNLILEIINHGNGKDTTGK